MWIEGKDNNTLGGAPKLWSAVLLETTGFQICVLLHQLSLPLLKNRQRNQVATQYSPDSRAQCGPFNWTFHSSFQSRTASSSGVLNLEQHCDARNRDVGISYKCAACRTK